MTIDYSKTSGEYRTNIRASSHEDLPFRLFYDVGIQSDLMTADGHSVDMTKLSAGYLDHYKITAGNIGQWNNNTLGNNQLSTGDVFFFSNWYSEARYDGYQTTTQDYTYGDPVVSFSPSIKNRYYFFQKPLPLYQKAYEYIDGKWQEIQNPATWTGGKCLKIAESLPQTGEAGQVVVVKSDLIKEKESLSKDGYYYLLIEYYEKIGGQPVPVQYVVSRKGTELGLGAAYGASITAQEMLCWYNTDQTASVAYRPYDENPGDGWVIAVKTGGLRTGEMQGEVTGKGGGLRDSKEYGYYYEDNKTRTSNNVYLPTVSPSSTLKDGEVTINEYLGNNGRLAISDTLMLVKKTVLDNSGKNAGAQKAEKFGYIVEIKAGGTSAASGYDGFTDLRNAIVVTRNDDDSNIWRRRIEYIDLVLSNRGYLQYSAANGSGEVEVDQNGEPKQGGGYYVYLKNNLADGETGNGNVYRIYRSNLGNGGVSEGVDADAEEGISTFSLTTYSLVPVQYADDPENHVQSVTGKIPIIRYDPTDPNSTAIQVTSEQGYEFETVYLTKSLYFGTEEKGGGALPEGFEVPAGWPWRDGEKAVAPPKNMSYFELSDGEGLLFSGMPSGTQYCVTEILSEENEKKGFGFTRALHNYAQSGTREYTGADYVDMSGEYRVPTENYGSTSAYEESIHFINSWNNNKKETEVNGQHVGPTTGDFYPSVKIGDLITYEIDWNNNETDADGTAVPARVTIEDLLDEGVDFYSASVSGVSGAELTAENKSVSGQLNGATFEISYDEDSRTVSWDLGDQPGAAKGTVKLVVKVNENAKKYWNYNPSLPLAY